MKIDEGTSHWILHSAAVERAFQEKEESTLDLLTEMGLTYQEAEDYLRKNAKEIARLTKELEYWQHGTLHPDFDRGEEFRLV